MMKNDGTWWIMIVYDESDELFVMNFFFIMKNDGTWWIMIVYDEFDEFFVMIFFLWWRTMVHDE